MLIFFKRSSIISNTQFKNNFFWIFTSIYYISDFTSVNSFQDELKFSSPSFYNLTPPPPPTSRPPGYDLQSNGVPPVPVPNGVIPSENYYAATDIVKVRAKILHFKNQFTWSNNLVHN